MSARKTTTQCHIARENCKVVQKEGYLVDYKHINRRGIHKNLK